MGINHLTGRRTARAALLGATLAAAATLGACGGGDGESTLDAAADNVPTTESSASDTVATTAAAPASATATVAQDDESSADASSPSTSAATTTTPPQTTAVSTTAAPATTVAPTTTTAPSTTVAPTTTAAPTTTTAPTTSTTQATSTTTAAPSPEKVRVTAVGISDRLNVRAAANASSSLLGSLGPNERGFDALETSNGWTRISRGSLNGWVNASYLDGFGACSTGTAPSPPVGPNYDIDGDWVLDTVWQTTPQQNADGRYHLNAVLAATGEHIETALDANLAQGGVSEFGAATDLTGDGVAEISAHYNLGATTSTWRFFTLVGCDFEQLSTSAGDPFEVNHGASASYVVSIACTSANGTSGGGVAHRTTTLDQSTSSPVFNATDRRWIWDGSAMTLDAETNPAPSPGQPHASFDTSTCQS